MNIAIIGCGFIAAEHVKALRSLGQQVQHVISTSDSAAKFAKTWNIPNYSTNLDSILDGSIDVIHICTPPCLTQPSPKQRWKKASMSFVKNH